MPDWLILIVGLVLLALVLSDRSNIATAWRSPARFWARDVDEIVRSRDPSEAFNLVVGIVLGLAATIYGFVSLIS